MGKEELKRKFILNEEELKTRIETLVLKALKHCRVDSRGRIHFENKKLSGKDKVKIALVARAIASELESNISADVTISELAQSTGLPENQVRARCTEFVAENYVESPKRGAFRAVFGRIELMLDSVPQSGV